MIARRWWALLTLGTLTGLMGCSGGGGSEEPAPQPGSDQVILALKPEGTNAIVVRAAGYGTGTISIDDPSQSCLSLDPEDSAHYSLVCWAYVPSATTSVRVTAAATDGSTFTGWSGPCAGAAEGTCVVPTDRDRIFNVGFAPIGPAAKTEYVLSVHVLGFVDGDISAPASVGLDCQPIQVVNYARMCTARVPVTTPPQQVTLTATPTETGTRFVGWGGSCGGAGTCTVTLDRDRGVTASFVRTGGSGEPADTTPPVVILTAPADGAAISGIIAVTASAVDSRGVAEVELVVDGARTALPFVEGTTGLYTASLDTTSLSAGAHALQVCATDAAANVACSSTVAVTVVPPASASWSVMAHPTGRPLYGIRGDSANHVWAVGQGIVLAWDGTEWTILQTTIGDPFFVTTIYTYHAVWGLPQSDSWLFSDNGQAWRCDLYTGACRLSSFPGHWSSWYLDNLMAAWGSAPDDLWAVDTSGAVNHWDGVAWTTQVAELNDRWWQNTYGTWFHDRWPLYGIWGSASSSVWAVGYNGAVAHWDGLAWSETSRPTSSHLYGIWGSSATDVWAVGAGGTILHWNGGAWSVVPSGTTSDLMAVWGASATDVWAVGAAGTIAHFDGTTWTSTAVGPAVTLRAVWGSSAADIWVTGDNGTILHYR